MPWIVLHFLALPYEHVIGGDTPCFVFCFEYFCKTETEILLHCPHLAKDFSILFSIIMNFYRNGLKAFYKVHFLNVFQKLDSLCYIDWLTDWLTGCNFFVCSICSKKINLENWHYRYDEDVFWSCQRFKGFMVWTHKCLDAIKCEIVWKG